MNNKEHDKQREIIDKLKEMPEIQDSRDKEEVYSRISSQFNISHDETKSVNKRKLIPIASSATAVLLLIILMPVFFNTDMQQISENSSMDQASDTALEENNENNENHATQYNQESSEQEINEDNSRTEQEISLMQTEYESFVVQDTDQNENIYFAGLSDIQDQYVIPIAFVTSGERDLQGFYNNMDEYISEWGNHTGEYLFENVEFQIDQSNNEISLELPQGYSLNGGSARANMFENILATMFHPYGTEKVTIKTDDGEAAELGHLGQIEEMPLQQVNPSSYKRYELGNIKMLIQIPNDEQADIEEAMMKMKEDEAEFHVFKTIPENVQFTTEPENNELNFILSDGTNLAESQSSVEMIDAILMTAKSYGYDLVKFENTDKAHIGPYNLTEPVPVPEAVNPIYLDE